jgi:hypothetical protein
MSTSLGDPNVLLIGLGLSLSVLTIEASPKVLSGILIKYSHMILNTLSQDIAG